MKEGHNGRQDLAQTANSPSHGHLLEARTKDCYLFFALSSSLTAVCDCRAGGTARLGNTRKTSPDLRLLSFPLTYLIVSESYASTSVKPNNCRTFCAAKGPIP